MVKLIPAVGEGSPHNKEKNNYNVRKKVTTPGRAMLDKKKCLYKDW